MPPDFWAHIWEFLTSPGFGGASALAAAGIAAWVALRRDRHTKESAARKAWWETLTWVYDRTVVDGTSKQPLSPSVTVGVLQALNRQTTDYARSTRGDSWNAEAQAVAALVEDFRAHVAIGSPELQPYVATLDELGQDLERRGFTGMHVGRAYRETALQAVIDLIREAGDDTISTRLGQGNGSLIVEQGNVRILVRAVYTETSFPPETQPPDRFADQVSERVTSPVIVITNQSIPPYLKAVLPHTKMRYIHWNGEGEIPGFKDIVTDFGIQPLRLEGGYRSGR